MIDEMTPEYTDRESSLKKIKDETRVAASSDCIASSKGIVLLYPFDMYRLVRGTLCVRRTSWLYP